MIPLVFPMIADRWRIQWSDGMPIRAKQTLDGLGVFFDFPLSGAPALNNGVHYVNIHQPTDVSGYTAMHLRGHVQASGPPVFKPNDHSETPPCFFNLFIQELLDDGTAADETFRWWSNPTRVALDGLEFFDVTVPLFQPGVSNWSDVEGKSQLERPGGFMTALRRAANFGFTFGGGSFFGHGVGLVSGAARFRWGLCEFTP